jgi:hypothetical protein
MSSFCRAAWRKEMNRFSWYRWEDSIKILLKETGWEGMNWIYWARTGTNDGVL